MRCGWGPYFRRTFEVQAGNSPLQGQSKPPAKLVVLISAEIFDFEMYQKLAFSEMFAVSLTERMLGALCVSVPMFGIAVLAPGSFGGGDVKLMCAAGALLGWRHILWSAAAGIFAAGVYVLYLLIIKNTGRKAEFPLGPFLCFGIAVNILTEIY